MHTQLNAYSLPVRTSNSGRQYSLMRVTYYPGPVLEGVEREREEEREEGRERTAVFDAAESSDTLSTSFGRGHSPLISRE